MFLIDEAHNLVERGRDMYSASIYKEDILEVKNLLKDRDKKLVKSLESVNKLHHSPGQNDLSHKDKHPDCILSPHKNRSSLSQSM